MRESEERWKQLCSQASVEQDPQKLLQLTQEINRLLGEKRRRLAGTDAQHSGQTGDSKARA
jgi:hypothetical protein